MRKTIILLLLILLLGIVTGAELDLSWKKPLVGKEIEYSWLLEREECIGESLRQAGKYDLAVSSVGKFGISVKKYFRYKDGGETFLGYVPGSDDVRYLAVQLRSGADISVGESNYNFLHYGWELQGRFSRRLSFYSEFWTGHFSDNDDNVQDSELIDSWIKEQESTIYLDNLRGKLAYDGELVDASMGRGRYQIGSGIDGSIILSSSCNDYGYITYDLDLGDFCFSTLNASLMADVGSLHETNDGVEYQYHENKYLTLHELSWQGNENLRIFMGEEVIYGAKDCELSYQLPFNFIRAIEHNLSDNDNVMIYSGWEWKKGNNVFYGNLLLDELKKKEIFSDWWGNKYALQIGDACWLNNQRLAVEFTAVRPWLYTHKSVLTRYSHDGRGLGYSEGSNLIQAAVAVDLNLSERLKVNCLGAFIRQGEEGNSWELNYEEEIEDIENEETKWLAGNPQNRWKLQAVVSWQALAHHWLKMGILSTIKDSDQENELYMSWLTRY